MTPELFLSLSMVVIYILHAFVLSDQGSLFTSWFLLLFIPIILLVLHIIFIISQIVKKEVPSIIDILFFIPILSTIFYIPINSHNTLYRVFLCVLLAISFIKCRKA